LSNRTIWICIPFVATIAATPYGQLSAISFAVT